MGPTSIFKDDDIELDEQATMERLEVMNKMALIPTRDIPVEDSKNMRSITVVGDPYAAFLQEKR